MTDFAFETTIPVRYRDLDTYGHVNNANYATYLEEARIDYIESVLGLEQESRGMLVATLSIDFRAPIDADEVVVGAAITRIGETSFEFEYELVADGRTVATAESVQVAYDPQMETKIPFPTEWREIVEEFEGDRVEIRAADGN